MTQYYLIAFALYFLFILNANAITKNEFIAEVKKTAGYKKIALSLLTAEQQKIISESSQSWNFSTTAQHSRLLNQENLLTQDEAESNNTIQSSISKPIYGTGGNLSLSYNWLKDNYNHDVTTDDYHDNTWELSYTQPLLKNYLGVVDKLDIDIATINLDIAKLRVKEQQQQYIVEKLKLFALWAKYQYELNFRKQKLALTNKLLRRAKKNKNSAENEVDILSQRDLVLTFEQDKLSIEQSLFETKQIIASLFTKPQILKENIEFDLDRTPALPKTKNIEDSNYFKALKLEIFKAERNLETLKNQQQAQLDLTASVIKQGQNADYTHALLNTSNKYTIGLTYSIPLGNTGAKASFKEGQLAVNEKKLNYQNQLVKKHATSINLRQKLKFLKKQIELSKKRQLNAIKITKKQQQRYNFAQADISDVTDAIDDEQDISVELLDYQKQYHNTYYAYLKLFDLI